MDPIQDIRQSLDAIDRKAAAGTEAKAAAEALQTDLADVKSRLLDMERVAARPQLRAPNGEYATPEQKAHADAFTNWLRKPQDPERKAALIAVQTKAASGLSDAAGGFAVPEVLSRQLETRVRDANPWRGLVRVIGASSGDVKLPVNNNDASVAWVGETGTRSATTEPTGAQRSPTFGTVYGYVSATEELVYDSQFDVASWFTETVGDAIAEAESTAIVSGNGTNKPTGFLNATPSSAGDNDSPARSAGTLQYLPSGVADGFGTTSTTSPIFNPEDAFADLMYAVKSQYRRNGSWVMNSNTAAAVRKLRDADGRAFWADSMAMGTPPLLMGRPVVLCEHMPDVGANAFPIGFGDWSRAYTLVELGGLRISVDDNTTSPGFIKLYVRRRLGGIVVNDDAVKLMKIAVS